MSEDVQGQAAEDIGIFRVFRGNDRRSLARGRLYSAAAEIHRPGERLGPGHPGPLRGRELPGVLQGIRRPAALGRVLAHHPGHQQPAVLEVVRRRQAERQLQLRRPAPGQGPEQGRADLGARTRGHRRHRDHLPGALPPGERVRRGAAGPRRPGGRPGHPAHADGARAARDHAGLRPARRRPLPGVRRVQRRRLRRPDRRLGQQDPHHDGRLLPQRRPARPQGQGGRGGRGGPQGGPGGRQGPGLAALPRPVLGQDPDGGGPGRLRRRPARRPQGRRGRAGIDAGRGAAVPDVHQRHHRPPQGLPALHRRLPVLRGRDVQVLPGHPPGRHVLVHGRHRLDHRPLLHRVRPARARHHHRALRGHAELPGRRASLADRRAARGEHLPHLPHRDPDAAQGRPGRAGQVQLPLQGHDHGGRADRARGLPVVLQAPSARARRSSPTPGGRPRPAASSAPACPACSP